VLKGNVAACKPVSTGDLYFETYIPKLYSRGVAKAAPFYTSHYSLSL